MSLTNCLNKFGKAFDARDAETIQARALELQESGATPTEAESQAVLEHIQSIDTQLGQIAQKAAEKGATVARVQGQAAPVGDSQEIVEQKQLPEDIEVSDDGVAKTYRRDGVRVSVMEDSQWSPRPNSIIDFVVDEESRGQGVGSKMMNDIIGFYGAESISAAASSPASVSVFYARGFRPVSNEDATLEESLEQMEEDSSVTMVVPSQILNQAQSQGYEGQDIGEAAEWTRAVAKGLDMSLEARMERARAEGYDTGRVLYHHTEASDIEGFLPSKDGKLGAGVYFSPDPDYGKRYVDPKKSNVVAAFQRGELAGVPEIDVALDISRAELGDNFDVKTWKRRANEILAEQGYVGKEINEEVVIFNPANIRSVNAAFDPDYSDSPNILAQSLEGAPSIINIEGRGEVEFGIFEPAVEVAKAYAENNGIDYEPVTKYTPVSKERAEAIAREYDLMEHAPDDPEVRAAYEALVTETIAQYEAMLTSGIEIEFIKGDDPYSNSPREAILDVVENNHLYVFSTKDGFGTEEDIVDTPMLAETEFTDINGEPMLVNDLFRAVHDYFGHIKNGVGFRAAGEENAWQAHASMYTPLARRAMTTETRGQNSWVNFGPYGDTNRTATAAETIYADQKVGLLPLWVSEEGRLGNENTRRNDGRYTRGLEGAIRSDGKLELVHYSLQPIERTDPRRAGTGLDRFARFDKPEATYFGIVSAVQDGYRREAGLGAVENKVAVDPILVYPANEDPEGLWVKGDILQTVEKLKQSGYIGYWANNPRLGKVGVIFDPLPVERPVQPVTLNQAQKNNIGLFSQVEQAVADMNFPQWKKPKKVTFTEAELELEEDLKGNPILSSKDERIEAAQALSEKRRQSKGLVSGQEILAKLKKSAGVKAEELEWLGIEDYLLGRVKKHTRDEVIEFIRENGVQIEEVVADQEGGDSEFEFDDGEVDDDPANWEGRAEDFMYDFENGEDTSYWFDQAEWLEDNLEKVKDNYLGSLDEEQAAELEEAEDLTDVENVLGGAYDVYDDMRQFMEDDAQEAAKGEAEIEYMNNPYRTYSTDVDEALEIHGNDDIGFIVLYEGKVVADGIWSLEEAKIQARDYAREQGITADEDDVSVAKYRDWTVSDDNYREYKLTLPELDSDFYYETHFPDRNLLAFVRVSDLTNNIEGEKREEAYPASSLTVEYEHQPDMASKHVVVIKANGEEISRRGARGPEYVDELRSLLASAPEGKTVRPADGGVPFVTDGSGGLRRELAGKRTLEKSFFIEELQSDWHQQGREKGYSQGLERYEIDDLRQEVRSKRDTLEAEARVQFNSTVRANEQLYNDILNADVNDAEFVQILQELASKNFKHSYDGGTGRRYDLVLKAAEEIAKTDQDWLYSIKGRLKEIDDLNSQIEAEFRGAPDAPFKGNNWLNLALKRSLINAIEEGYDRFAWAGSEILVDRWSERYRELYENQYDKKMPSMVKKLTGIEPQKFGEEWSIPLTQELKDKILGEGLPLFQKQEQAPRGSLEILPDNKRVMRLGEASDLSTFIHESAHLFLELEKQFAAEFGVTENQQKILNYLGIKSFEELDLRTPAGVEMHERFAETFEVYARTGKAPSVGLRDAFAQFARWLTRIYVSLKDRRLARANLTPEITEAFDRMLATQEEIDRAAANPAYDQFFRSAEQAGMTDAQFKEYQEKQAKVKQKADADLYEQVLNQIKKRQSKEWKEEKRPLVESEKAELAKQPVYQIIQDLKDNPLDIDAVKDVLGIDKMKGRLIGRAKKGGVDPQEYAEVYGYSNVKEMLNEILDVKSLNDQANENAQAAMIAKYGDILNDGSAEDLAQEALHNNAKAELLLAELKAMNKGKPTIDRERLKAQAKTLIGSLNYKQIQPNKYYRAEIKAAQRAVTAETEQERIEAKTQQLALHYIYQEALKVKERMEKNRKYVRGVQNRDYDTKQVHPLYVENMKMLAKSYDMSTDQAKASFDNLINWVQAQVEDENQYINLEMMDLNLVRALVAKQDGEYDQYVPPKFEELTAEELQSVVDMLRHMRFVGGRMADVQKAEQKAKVQRLANSILKKGGKDKVVRMGETERGEGFKKSAKTEIHRLSSLRNLMRRLDGFEDGPAKELIYQALSDGSNRKLDLREQLYDKYEELMSGHHKLGLSKAGRTEQTITKQDGKSWTLSAQGRFMLAMYWGTESSRDAIREGYNVTDADVMNMLSFLTKEQLELVNATWEVNESLWPELSKASTNMLGAAPPKLDAAPFTINGVKMTGGHMRLYYRGTKAEMKEEQNKGSQIMQVTPSRTGSTYARVGSGGKEVSLEISNLHRSWDDTIHYIAFAESGRQMAGLLNATDVREAIIQKHGEPFYNALIQTVGGVTNNNGAQEQSKLIANAMNITRRALTAKYLMWSVRNVAQQITSLPIAFTEVGTGRYIEAALRISTNRKEVIEEVNSKSSFMRNRAQLVNREAREFLKTTEISGQAGYAWKRFAELGFSPQTAIDSVIAYPAWLAAYEKAIEGNKTEKEAISDADTAVAESVGSGSDLHLGGMFQENNPEWIKALTLMGSWMNMIYQRIERSSKGFSEFNRETFVDTVLLPFFVAVISSAIIMDVPSEEEDDPTTWLGWMFAKYASFLGGTVPILRDVVSSFNGFAPKSPLGAALEAPAKVTREIDALLEGRQSAAKFAVDVGLGTITTFVPIAGSGNITRFADYMESYDEGNEGNTFNIYQALVEGSDKND